MTYKSQEIEINEAIQAANLALKHLYRSEQMLSNARNWGLVDIFGGGWITTYVKRNRIKEAQNEVDQAVLSLKKLSRELHDVRDFSYIQLDIRSSEFADFIFDGPIADIVVQNQIANALSKIRTTIDKVERIKTTLENM